MPRKLRCLVVDDSAIYRKIVRDILSAVPEVEVVGNASDGQHAVRQIESLKPDLVTLDLEMPNLDGIGVLRELKRKKINLTAIMVSAFTARGAKATTEALSLGAFDFILKPTTNSLDESVQQLRRDLIPKIKASQRRSLSGASNSTATRPSAPARPAPPARPTTRLQRPAGKPSIVAIGISTGGPQTLARILPRVPKSFPVPIVIVQHMPPMFTKSLADDLDRRCQLTVTEATQGQPLRAGEVVIAPGGQQMRIARGPAGFVVQLTDDPPERNCKPSADYLFRSVASTCGSSSLGVILTGMGDDGTLGAQQIKASGGMVLAQDEATSVVYGMPRSVVEHELADAVVPLEKIHDHLIALASGRVLA